MVSTLNSPHIKTVSQITTGIKHLLEGEYRFTHVTGEISNLRTPYSGHSYFILKDQNAQLRSVIFKNQKRYLDKPLKDGQQVICHGRISVYEPRGEYQLIVDTLNFDGSGNLQAAFEDLKTKLYQEGLFSEGNKKPIPPFPKNVAVVTSASGAALQDFLKIHTISNSNCNILIVPSTVQGDNAAKEISKALLHIERIFSVDAIVLTRGGGSIEDLWAFNDETLARIIHKLKTPIISAVGHEIDFTIADFCSDYRCPTPTAAAELLFSDRFELSSNLLGLQKRLRVSMDYMLSHYSQRTAYSIRALGDLRKTFQSLELRVDYTLSHLKTLLSTSLAQKQHHLHSITATLHNASPIQQLELKEQQTRHLSEKLTFTMKSILQQKESSLMNSAGVLDSVSPLATMARGYSIVQKVDRKTGRKKIISDVTQTFEADNLRIKLSKGDLECEVTKVILQ